MNFSALDVVNLFSVWCENVEEDKAVEKILKDVLGQRLKLIWSGKVEKAKVEDKIEKYNEFLVLFTDSPEPDGTPKNPIVKLLYEQVVDEDELETKKPLFVQLFSFLVADDFTVRDLLDAAEKVSKVKGRGATSKVIMELVVQYVEYELFELLRIDFIKNSQNNLLDKIQFAFAMMFHSLNDIHKFEPKHIFQHIIPQILFDLKSPSFTSTPISPQSGEYVQLSFVVFPLVLLRLTLIMSVLCGYSSFRTYAYSFKFLTSVVCRIYKSYFNKIDEIDLNNPQLQSLDLSHKMFITLFAESIKMFVSSLPKQVKDSINQTFVQQQDDEPIFESFTDILFHTFLDEDIFKISDFRDLLKKKDLMVGVKTFRELYRRKIQENRKSDEFDDDD
jgi:hypothetical protein